MTPSVEFLDLGVIDYNECWERQQELFDALVAEKMRGAGDPAKAGWLILCEHPHVYTLGKSGRCENLLVSEEFLRSVGTSFHRTDRGGDITYHGPGQIVGYPILDLEKTGMGLRDYIEAVEQSVIETVAEFGIAAGRSEGKTGVWVRESNHPALRAPFHRRGTSRTDTPLQGNERKICAIGVRSSRFITMHGFALNVATDLKYFDHINPCGFMAGGVTSIEAETGKNIPMDEVKRVLCGRLGENLRIVMNYEL